MAMTNEQFMKAVKARDENPGIGRRRLVAITGCTAFAAQTFLKQGNRDLIPDTKKTAKGVKTLADFRQAYDKDTIVPAKIRGGIAALGPDGWEYEVEFAKMCGISLYDIGRYRDMFTDHVVQISKSSKRAWAATKALAAKMREML